jgi:hypothetical protein
MRPTILLPIAAFAAILAFAVIASIAGPVRMGDPIIPFDDLLQPQAQPRAPEDIATPDPIDGGFEDQLGRVGVGLLVLGGMAATVAMVALYSLVSLLLAGRDPAHRLVLGDASDAVDLDIEAVLREQASRSAQALQSTPTGEASNAVVACWVELEGVAEAAGQPRARAQTPTEFTAMLLAELSGDQQAVDTLLELYHRARFSSSPLPDHAAATAADSLHRLSLALVPRS